MRQASHAPDVVKGTVLGGGLLPIDQRLLLLLLFLVQALLPLFQRRLLMLLNNILAHKMLSEHGALLVLLVAVVDLYLLELVQFVHFLIYGLHLGLSLLLFCIQALLAELGEVLDFLALRQLGLLKCEPILHPFFL